MKQLRLTLIASCLLIGLGFLIMLQSEYVKSAFIPYGRIQPVKRDFHALAFADTGSASSQGLSAKVQTDEVLADKVGAPPIIGRITGAVIKNEGDQIIFSGEEPAATQVENTASSSAGEDILNNQSVKNERVKITTDVWPMINNATGQPVKDIPDPLDTYGPVRLAAPHVETEASDWLGSGDENAEREDPQPFLWPAEKHWLSGYNYSIYHPGIDIAANMGDLIFAAASGKVITVNYSNQGYGNMVIINHLNGFQTLYAHLNTILTEMDTYVIQGQPIGLAGSTGNSTGAHLHFEIHDQGKYVNPWLFLTE